MCRQYSFLSLTGEGIPELKDLIWSELNKPSNQIIEISHAPIPVSNQKMKRNWKKTFSLTTFPLISQKLTITEKMDWDDWNE
jgi:hypothetical protein